MSLALVHLKGLACTRPAVITPAKTKEAARALGNTVDGVIFCIKHLCEKKLDSV
jgi:hypothetical protein